MADEQPATRIVDALLGDGELVDAGGFTLDPAAAAAKLAAFTYADRQVYLVPLAEALFGLGATSLRVATHGPGLVVSATDVVLTDPRAALVDLFAFGLGRSDSPRARALARLAVALDMVLGGGEGHHVELVYTDAGARVRADYRWREAPRIEVGAATTEARGSIEVTVFEDRDARATAIDALERAIRWSPREVLVDGHRRSQKPRSWLAVSTGEGPGYRFQAGLEPRDGPAVVELWSAGVCVDVMPCPGLGFRAELELDVVRRDLSRMKVVRDAGVEAALTAIDDARQRALAQLDARDQVWAREGWPPEWPPERVDRILDRPIRAELAGREIAHEPVSALALMRRHYHHAKRKLGWFEAGILTLVGLATIGSVAFVLVTAPLGTALGVTTMLLPLVALYAQLLFKPWAAFRAVRTRDGGVEARARVTGTDLDLRATRSPRAGAKIELVRVEWEFQDREGATHTGWSLLREREEAHKWPRGLGITIYYDPADPGRSVWAADVGPRRG